MGIIIHDEITLPSGLKVTDAYAGFASNSILVTPVNSDASPTGKVYVIQSPYNLWVSDECRQAGNDPLMTKQLSFTMGPDGLTKGVYSVLYAQMCRDYSNVTNMDAPPAPGAAAQQPASRSSS